jgi:hypothetical protein
VVVIVAAASVVGCAGGTTHKNEAAVPVPVEIVPKDLAASGLTLHINADKDTTDAFATAGPNALVGDGKVWELRAADRLVGALEIATLKTRVDPAKEKDRKAILGQVLPGNTERIEVVGQPVWTAKGDSKTKAVFVFFGAHMLGILQLKGKGIEINTVSTDLISRVTSQPLWDALPPEAFDDKPPADK